METGGQGITEQAQARTAAARQGVCVECLEASETTVSGRRGEVLCAACAESYYAPCASCGGLVPQDEAIRKEAALHCQDCAARPADVPPEDAPGDEEVESLVAEYVALHAEDARVKKRLDAIKERLKVAASVRQRVAGAVTLRGGDAAIKCSFRATLKCDDERVAELERVLGAEQFESLFQRSVKYSPLKENLEKLLDAPAGGDAELRKLVLTAVERSEQPTLTVVRAKKGKSDS